jgi:hypothetical protein
VGVLVALGVLSAAAAHAAETAASRVDAALQNITTLVRAGKVGYATAWDGNKYIQCRRIPDRSLRCEAAGTSMQPSLKSVLTGERLARLGALGWLLDPSFGNFVRIFPANVPTARVAEQITQTLAEAYGADIDNLEIQTSWIADVRCPPRNGPTQNLAGIVNDAPSMESVAVYACSFTPAPDALEMVGSAAELISRYGPKVTAEIQRLRINLTRHVFAVFDAGIGYVQCAPETASPPMLYCEAQSAETWATLKSILTPERVARLHNIGYADPGRAPNYWRTYALDKFDDGTIANELLTILYDVYGYRGAQKLETKTE